MNPAEAERKQEEILKGKSGEERIKSALNLNELTKRITKDGIRAQFPKLSSDEIEKLFRLRIRND